MNFHLSYGKWHFNNIDLPYCLFFPKNEAENCLAVAYFFQQDVLKIAYKLSDMQQPLTFRPSCFIDK